MPDDRGDPEGQQTEHRQVQTASDDGTQDPGLTQGGGTGREHALKMRGIFAPASRACSRANDEDPTACFAERIAWPSQNATKTRISLTTTATVPNTATLASRTTGRRGTADRVARMVPVPYSALITSTPSTPKMSWPRKIPIRLRRVGSSMTSVGLTVPVVSAQRPTTAIAVPASVQAVDRTVQSLVHSAAAAWRRPTLPRGRSPDNELGASSATVTIPPGTQRPGRSTP